MEILEELNKKTLGATVPSWAKRAAEEIVALRSQVETCKEVHALDLKELEFLRIQKFARFNNEDCWIYQGFGDDHLESLVCPVVISAPALIELIDQGDTVMIQRECEPGVWVHVYPDHVDHYKAKGQAIRELCIKNHGEIDG
jgi:hypothetical protein